ncbi:permease [Candidatus Peribacteria bacterium]|jgi:uncharacterized protein|nr:permease [Candidatus Peribacteria bacterium]MBT4021459.1 permease [Candidatus Peribacteria bacterium]MBT4240369.1 permease [Candidatus Peribacteria bacterium]MBT4473792.1 permease [Candidatus Peribacteria bacterium]
MIDSFASWLTFETLNIAADSHMGLSIHFFVYETVKIMLMLIAMTHVMSLFRHYLPIDKMQEYLSSRHFFGLDYFLASTFGAITPFCSCSSIPLFIGFLQARIPLGLTFAFLTTSPLVNEVAIVIFLSAFGWKITLLYTLAGMTIGMLSGLILGKMNLEKEIDTKIFTEAKKPCCCKCKKDTQNIFKQISNEAFSITKKIMPFVILGIAIGAGIHGYVPEGYFEDSLSGNNIFSVPIAVILAVPLYANASSVIPIVQALISKGVALGTALAFMMAIVGISLPEALILKRVMSWKLLGRFFAIVTIGIIIIGYLFNTLPLTLLTKI